MIETNGLRKCKWSIFERSKFLLLFLFSHQLSSTLKIYIVNIVVLLFDDFETLDVFGPVEIFGRLIELYTIKFHSLNGGEIINKHGLRVLTHPLQETADDIEIFIIPGGIGTRKEVENLPLINQIKAISIKSKYVCTICTGSALLAKTGLLDQKNATTNKRAFSWVMSIGTEVSWDKKARWVIDDKYYTSSGVSAGMDMALGFLSDRYGIDFARKIALEIEYNWTEDKENDRFQAI